MEAEWRAYLREHAPELYQQMLADVTHSAKWRDERIDELESALRQFVDLHDYCHCDEMPDGEECEVCVAVRVLEQNREGPGK